MSSHVRGLHDLRGFRFTPGSRPRSGSGRFLELHSLEVERTRILSDRQALRRREEQVRRRLAEVQARMKALLGYVPEETDEPGRSPSGSPRRVHEMTLRYGGRG